MKYSTERKIAKALWLFMIVFFAESVLSSFLLSLQPFLISSTSFEPRIGLLFVPVLGAVALSSFWKYCKKEHVMVVVGQIIIFAMIFNLFSMSNAITIIIQSIGMVFFLVGVIRIVIFLLTNRSAEFIEGLLSKRK